MTTGESWGVRFICERRPLFQRRKRGLSQKTRGFEVRKWQENL